MSERVTGVGAEKLRLWEDAKRLKNWKRWGPYLAERQWATVREDYSADGNVWESFPHDQARSRAYRWGEDGILGICDRECRLCFSVALWNGKDPILKERLFGLTGPEGNHGEDVKEYYFYQDSTPTHSYMRGLYRYPQAAFPYDWLVAEGRRRGRSEPEFEIGDTGIFNDGKYFDIEAEYAKAGENDLLISLWIWNRSMTDADLHVLPTLWFRNSWAWGCTHEGCEPKGWMGREGQLSVKVEHATLGEYIFTAEEAQSCDRLQDTKLLFTENETNCERLYGCASSQPYVKDAFHRYVIQGDRGAVNPAETGTKAAVHYRVRVPAGAGVRLRMRLRQSADAAGETFGDGFEQILALRKKEADEFYSEVLSPEISGEERRIARGAMSGLLWSKQFYHYVVESWLEGDPNMPTPPAQRLTGRNADWSHVFSRDVLAMPDKWEYPWFAAWDLGFHMIPMSKLDGEFAKEQLILMLREWYMHPNGQLPAYEFAFGDANPPVHAWSVWRVYKMTGPRGKRDVQFLKRAFTKLLLNFTWWVNRKDLSGKHVFAGGFLGLDNVGLFDRSQPLPDGTNLNQADGTAWMAFYCGTMLSIALELAMHDPAYEDVASKFFEHFVDIIDAINMLGGVGLWDETDGFYYDHLKTPEMTSPLRVRSIVGLIPVLAVEILEKESVDKLPGFSKRMRWFLEHRQDLARHISFGKMNDGTGDALQQMEEREAKGHYLLAIPSQEKLERVLRYAFDESEFLSPYGLRSVSKFHQQHPCIFNFSGQQLRLDYEPGESTTGIFGGNSNWRGPVWFPLNYLFVEALERYHHFYGDNFTVEYPTGSGVRKSLGEISGDLRDRMVSLFVPGTDGTRPGMRRDKALRDEWSRDLLLFHEYFHGDTGDGLGASHQTGWTSLVASLIMKKQWEAKEKKKAQAKTGAKRKKDKN